MSHRPSRFQRRAEADERAARRGARGGGGWGRRPVAGAWAAMPAAGGGRAVPAVALLGDDAFWGVDLAPQPQQDDSLALYTYFGAPEQEVPVPSSVFPHQWVDPSWWWAGPEYGTRDFLFQSESPPVPQRPEEMDPMWHSAWMWDEASGDVSTTAAADPYDAVALDASDASSETEVTAAAAAGAGADEEERESMFRVERDGPPRPKQRGSAVDVSVAGSMRRGRGLESGDSADATPMGVSSRSATIPTTTTTTTTTTNNASPPVETNWTLRSKAERPEEEEDFIRCQQLSRCSDRPPCPGCLCFLCPGCQGSLRGGGEGTTPTPAPAPTSPSAGLVATTAPAVTCAIPAPTSATVRTAPLQPCKHLWGPCRIPSSTRAC